jgi:serine protease Do
MIPHAKGKLAWAAAGVIAVGAVTGFTAPGLLRTAQADAPGLSLPSPSATPSAIPPGTAPNYAQIFAKNQAAVVSITSVTQATPAEQDDQQQFDFGQLFGPEGPFGGDENNPFSQFFRNFQGPNRVPVRALGSGFIVNADGLILTNAHVVGTAKTVTVTLSDHRQFKGKVLGADKSSDIAVVKIDAHKLPTVRIGDADSLAVGDYVMAIGAPFGLTESATSGIVSALSRSLPNDGYVNFIQTDAPVNPGNSGGPLFNATGSVVGINSQIYSNSGGYEGIAFAIPINFAERVADQLVKTGHVEHGQLGVEVQNVNQSLANSFKLNTPEGALVAKVQPDSAAERAGIKVGDVITRFDGHPIADAGQLAMSVNTTPPGQKATLTVWRDGKSTTITATITSADSGSGTESHSQQASEQTHLGLTVRPLTSGEREQAGVSHGLVVESARGNAAEAGIQRGDVVLAIDGTPVQSVSQLRELVQKDSKDNQVALLIQRGDNRIFVPIELG